MQLRTGELIVVFAMATVAGSMAVFYLPGVRDGEQAQALRLDLAEELPHLAGPRCSDQAKRAPQQIVLHR